MQKEDSYFTDSWIIENGGESALQNACNNPPEALSQHLQTVAPTPRETAVERSFDSSTIPGILIIIYTFEGPE